MRTDNSTVAAGAMDDSTAPTAIPDSLRRQQVEQVAEAVQHARQQRQRTAAAE
jgi:hypothetical protein